MYVDRDCCSGVGGSKTAVLFNNWDRLVVRLDIWHLMRRFASGVTTESHQLYGPFMGRLSACIFEWDAEDVRRLLEAKRSQLAVEQGMVDLTDEEVSGRVSRKEMGRHCRTRPAAIIEMRLIDLLEAFDGEIIGAAGYMTACFLVTVLCMILAKGRGNNRELTPLVHGERPQEA